MQKMLCNSLKKTFACCRLKALLHSTYLLQSEFQRLIWTLKLILSLRSNLKRFVVWDQNIFSFSNRYIQNNANTKSMSTWFLYFKLNGINQKDSYKKACGTSWKSVSWLNKYEECCNEKKLNVPLNPSNQVQYRQLGMRLNVSHKSEITKVKSSKFYRLILQWTTWLRVQEPSTVCTVELWNVIWCVYYTYHGLQFIFNSFTITLNFHNVRIWFW